MEQDETYYPDSRPDPDELDEKGRLRSRAEIAAIRTKTILKDLGPLKEEELLEFFQHMQWDSTILTMIIMNLTDSQYTLRQYINAIIDERIDLASRDL